MRSDAFRQSEFVDAAGHLGAAMLKGNRFVYTGRECFAPLGLPRNRHRYFEPDVGRRLTLDPLGEEGGTNLSGYVDNSPNDAVDPLDVTVWEESGCGEGLQ